MKNFKYLLGVAVLLAFAFAFGAWDKPATTEVTYSDGALEPMAVGGYNRYNYRKDTITNAELDTFKIGVPTNILWNETASQVNFLSLYTYDISVVRANLSGTTSIKLYLDASNFTTGTSTDWVTIDSTTTTTATNARMRSTDATATRYRIRVVGAGTQSSTYQIWSIWKRKN